MMDMLRVNMINNMINSTIKKVPMMKINRMLVNMDKKTTIKLTKNRKEMIRLIILKHKLLKHMGKKLQKQLQNSMIKMQVITKTMMPIMVMRWPMIRMSLKINNMINNMKTTFNNKSQTMIIETHCSN